MYLLRRVFKVKPGTAREAAPLIARIGKVFEEAGQRSPTRVYMSGGTVPGPADTIYLEWTEEVLRPPFREGNVFPAGLEPLGKQLREYVEESYIEFYEMYVPG